MEQSASGEYERKGDTQLAKTLKRKRDEEASALPAGDTQAEAGDGNDSGKENGKGHESAGDAAAKKIKIHSDSPASPGAVDTAMVKEAAAPSESSEAAARIEELSRSPKARTAIDRSKPTSKTDVKSGGPMERGMKGVQSLTSRGSSHPGTICDEDIFEKLTMLSWNIDATNAENLTVRLLSVVDTIVRLKPVLILLQECTDASVRLFRRFLEKPYFIIEPNEATDWNPYEGAGRSTATKMPYFPLILASRFHLDPIGLGKTFYFPNTVMGRQLLCATFRWRGADGEVESAPSRGPVTLVASTAHLESMKDFGDTRKEQLRIALQWMAEEFLAGQERGGRQAIFFGGDLNLRDSEVEPVREWMAGVGIRDCWEEAGSDFDTWGTWDMVKNRNLYGKAKLRFDRVYMLATMTDEKEAPAHSAEPQPFLKVEKFELEGTKTIDSEDQTKGWAKKRCHPSDHFALYMRFSFS